MLQRLASQIKEAFRHTKRKEPHIERIAIYGELFGGGYPHPDVKAEPSVQPIQTGVYYCPSIDFYAFDIIIEGNHHHVLTRRYLDYDQALQIFERSALFHGQTEKVAHPENRPHPLPPRTTGGEGRNFSDPPSPKVGRGG